MMTVCLTFALAALVTGAPSAFADDPPGERSITTVRECVFVDWSASPVAVQHGTGCVFPTRSQPGDPCVYVDWTQTPPYVAPSTNCQMMD